ncbi:unnamed protein product [Acanthosepion pharaonis]|uniref:SH3 domain-containing protein n=1 Tax=Acanthosepion pharaonis TaxID=158019 RepID=A0A812B503_ACAPH|nr:unnamed protein product [Sepia pharaonis]
MLNTETMYFFVYSDDIGKSNQVQGSDFFYNVFPHPDYSNGICLDGSTMSVSISDNNTMTTSATSTELQDTNSVSTPIIKAGIPAIPKRPTIIRVDKENVQENTDESKSKEVPKVPPRPPPPRPGPPATLAKQAVAQKSFEGDKKKKKPEITIVSARPMSEICFRDKKPEIPVPPRPQKLKDQGEASSTLSINSTSVALSTNSSKQIRHSTTDVRSKSDTLPPRPHLPPATVTRKDLTKVPPQRPAPLKSTLSASTESFPPPRPPACSQLENSQPHPNLRDISPHLAKEQLIQLNSTGKSLIPPKPRPRTFIDSSSKTPKPVIVQRSVSAYKHTKNGIPPQPLPRKLGTSFTVESDASKACTVDEPIAEVTPPPKPTRHQSFRNTTSPIHLSTRTCSSPPSQSQETSSKSISALSSAKASTTEEEVLDTVPPSTEEATPTNQTDPSSSESTEAPESFKVEKRSSSTEKTAPCPLPPKKNSLVISQSSIKSSSEEDAPVPSPRIKHSSKADTSVLTPINNYPGPIVCDTPASTLVNSDAAPVVSDTPASTPINPDAATIVSETPASTPINPDPTPIASDTPASTPVNPDPALIVSEEPKDFILPSATEIVVPPTATVNKPTIIRANSAEKQPNLSVSSEKLPLEEKTANIHPKDPEVRRSKVPPPIPKKNPISANICDRNIPNDLKKPSTVKSRKATDMLQTTKDYTRRITQSLGFTAAEEPTTVWYTDKSDEPEEKVSSLDKKKENPSIWYVDAVPEEETDANKTTFPQKSALQTDKSKKPEKQSFTKDKVQKLKDIDKKSSQPAEEPSPTEISAFQKYHSYMRRTIEEAVGIQLRKNSSSLIDDDINEEKEGPASDIIKPVKPEPPKQKPPIPPKVESRPHKPSAPPQVKPNVPAVPPKRPPVPASITQVLTKPDGPAVRPPPPRPKPVVSVKPTVSDNQNIISDSDSNLKSVNKSRERTPSIENLIGKFEEELCKKTLPPPRPAQPANKLKIVTSNLTDNQEQQLSSQNKETAEDADTKMEITSMPSNIGDDSSIQPDENENLSINAAEVSENTGGTEESLTSNLTANSSVDENANEEAEDEQGKIKETKTVTNVNEELATEETTVTETKSSLNHKVGYTDSFNQRCNSLMNDLKTHFENLDKDDIDDKIKEVVQPSGESLHQLDVNPEKMQDSNSNEETEEKELDEKVEPESSEEKSSDHLSLEPDSTEMSEKISQDDSTSQLESKVESDTNLCAPSLEISTLVIELDSKDSGHKESPKSSSTSELTGPRAIVNFDFDAQEEDEITLKTPSDTNGNTVITDVSQKAEMEDDATKVTNVDSQGNSTQVMDDAYQSLSEVRTGSAPESIIETEAVKISAKDVSEGAAKDDAEEDELTDSDQLDKISIPVGGEETIAYALYDFVGEDGELSFKEGDAITILKWVNEDWLLGKKDELVGNLPANFVNFMGDSTDELDLVYTEGPPEPKEPPPPLQPDVLEHVKRLKGFACARFDFEARDDDELSFKDGDRIEILEFVNNDWIRGSLHKKEGIFPAAFVSVEEFSPDEENCTSETTKVRALHDFIASADDELSFKSGAIITCHGDVPNLPGWSRGSFEGRTGMFPAEFVIREGI